jgi:hypothetical protein
MLKYSQIYQRVEVEAKCEKEFDRWANKMVVFTNRPYIDTYLFVIHVGYLLQRLASAERPTNYHKLLADPRVSL